MADDRIQQDGISAEIQREAWRTPRVTRFGAAGARFGENINNNEDGETNKS